MESQSEVNYYYFDFLYKSKGGFSKFCFRNFLGSFEISVSKSVNSKQQTKIWTGIEKGPPRKEKFPEPSVLVDAIKAFASKS